MDAALDIGGLEAGAKAQKSAVCMVCSVDLSKPSRNTIYWKHLEV